MASWRDINDLAKDPARVRLLAEQLLAVYRDDLTNWELDFLESVLSCGSADQALTTRQAEKLVEIRDHLKRHTTVGGFNVKRLIADCDTARLDLGEDDEDFICRVRGSESLRHRDLKRLLHCARQLHLVEGYINLDAA